VKVGPNKSKPVSTVPLNDDGLQEMLTEMGYEVQASTYTDGNGDERKYFNIAAENYWVNVCLGGGDSYDDQVFLICDLLDVADIDRVPASKWADILAANDSYFGHMILLKPEEGPRKLKAIKCVANRNLSSELLNNAIVNFDQFIVNTKPIWTDNNWSK
jgi:hypothetical protein